MNKGSSFSLLLVFFALFITISCEPVLEPTDALVVDSGDTAKSNDVEKDAFFETDESAPDSYVMEIVETSDDETVLPDVKMDQSESTDGVLPEEEGVFRFSYPPSTFYSFPFPSNIYYNDGKIDLSLIPNPKDNSLIKKYSAKAEELANGFSTNPVIYFGLNSEIDESKIVTFDKTVSFNSPIVLVNIDESSKHYKEIVPVRIKLITSDNTDFFETPCLVIYPVHGFPLAGGSTYALIVKKGFVNDEITYKKFQKILKSEGNKDLVSVYAPLVKFVENNDSIKKEDILIATVFTTGEPVYELKKIRDFIWDSDFVPQVLSIKQVPGNSAHYTYEGKISSWNFQQGTPPYSSGGGFVFDSNGNPVVDHEEDLTFAISVPQKPFFTKNGKLPIVIYSHGTGGNYKTFISSGVSIELASLGIPVIGINQPLHGDRWAGSNNISIDVLELYTFNFSNPDAGVSIIRQGAIDNIILTKFFKLNGKIKLPDGTYLEFDPDHIYFFGHSQGGLVGSLLFGVEPEIKGGVLSGTGGLLTDTILLRKDPVDIQKLVATALGIPQNELTEFAPPMTIIQTASDCTDPINYAPFINVYGNTKHYVMTEGLLDPYTPSKTAENLALAMRLGFLKPASHIPDGFDIIGLKEVSLPVSGNIKVSDTLSATALLVQFPDSGHYPVFEKQLAKDLYKSLFDSMINDEDPPKIQ